MEPALVESLIDERVQTSLAQHRTDMLKDIETMFQKISGNNNSTQLNRISGMLSSGKKIKRKSNEEQYKYNANVNMVLDDADNILQTDKLAECRQKIVEARDKISHRQKLIKLADASELGWRVVNEYESNPLASDSDDEKRIYKAEVRATRKMKAEKAKKSRGVRSFPYRRQLTSSQTAPSERVPVSSTGQPRRPMGLCFACGKPGHWKGSPECPASNSSNKISICSSLYEHTDVLEHCKLVKSADTCIIASTESSDACKVVSPVGRLKRHISKWRVATDSKYILDVVENGYKLPFRNTPVSVELKNNKSARDNPVFVENEIQQLLTKGVISRSEYIPLVVNPLTMAYNRKGKPRMVLDCRHINACLHLFKVTFEDIKIAESIFERNSFLFTYDLKSAYHHIDIFQKHRPYLGFSYSENGKKKYYVFNSLPFGIKTAGHIFTKALKVVVSYLRAKGHKNIMFLDDGIGGSRDFDVAFHSSQYVRQSLIDFGFLMAEDKCSWYPCHIVCWLGHLIDMEQNKLFIANERIERLELSLKSLIFQIKTHNLCLIPVRFLASVVGQVISLQSVIGNVARLMTRGMFACINSRASWNAPVKVTVSAFHEIEFWQNNARKINEEGKVLLDTVVCLYNIYSDASSVAYGGYIESNILDEQNVTRGLEMPPEVGSLRYVDFKDLRPPEAGVGSRSYAMATVPLEADCSDFGVGINGMIRDQLQQVGVHGQDQEDVAGKMSGFCFSQKQTAL